MLIDVSTPLSTAMPTWPGSPGWSAEFRRDVRNGDPVTESTLTFDAHCGTHVDAPLHHIATGLAVDSLPLDAFVGPAFVLNLGDNVSVIEPVHLEQMPIDVQRILFRTRNSNKRLLEQNHFAEDFVALSLEAAKCLADFSELKLVGVDYLSVQLYGGDDETHRVLMRKGIALLEGLNLHAAQPGPTELLSLPLLIPGAEAAPVRAVLRSKETS